MRINPRVLYTFLSAAIILVGTFVAIQYARGKFRITRRGFLPQTGLLQANSFPTGAEVYINDRLVSATDDTLYLEPGTYQVRITKEGYKPWQKEVTVNEELVTQTNAVLFPQVPSLTPLTFTGVDNILPAPDGQRLVYYTASASAETKNGLYVLNLNNSLLSLQRDAKQISDDPSSIILNLANLIWSPDSSQLMMLAENRQVLLNIDTKQDLPTLPDISFQQKTILSQWEEEMYIRERQFLREFPTEVIEMATQSAKNVYLSPDKKRLLYTATEPVTLADELIPPVPASNSQPETRNLVPGGIYVYDREEDRNFQVGEESMFLSGDIDVAILNDDAPTPASFSAKQLLADDLHQAQPNSLEASPSAFSRLQATTSAQLARNFTNYHTSLYSPTFQWFPDSKHLLYTTDNEIHIMEYDGTNNTTVYAGPFAYNFVYPWPDGSRLLILTSFSPNTPLNLYAVELK